MSLAIEAVRLDADLLEELLEFLLDHVVDLFGDLIGLVREGRNALHNGARDHVEVLLNGLLEILERHRLLSRRLDRVGTGFNNVRVVAGTTTVEGKQVGGVLGDV